MKKTELVKSLGSKIRGQMQQTPIPNRFGGAASALPDRREQRKLDQAAGLVPFAAKLPQDLVKRLQEQAVAEGVNINELTTRVIEAGLGGVAGPAKATQETAGTVAKKAAKVEKVTQQDTSAKPAAKKAAAKKTAAKKTT